MKKYSRVYLEIGNICNMNCSFCHGTKRAPLQMSAENFRIAAEKLRPVTDYLYLHLMGEPLCHPELIKIIAIACELGFKCAITTNGTLLCKLGKALLDSGVYKINISLHSFEKASSEQKSSYIRSCLSFADAASKKGILTVLRLWNGEGNSGKNSDSTELIAEYFSSESFVFGARGYRIRNKLHVEYGEKFDWPDPSAADMGENVFCYGLSDHFGVLADGTVVPCCLDSDANIPLGNIFSEDIEKILTSERADAIRCGFSEHKAAEPLCRRCGYARRFKI